MAKYLAGIDIGTTGSRCMIFDFSGSRIAGEYREYGATYPKPGWVEQDAGSMIEKTMEAAAATIDSAGIDPAEIAAIGFSTQRSVTCPLGKNGDMIRPMISWQDARTAKEVEAMRRKISDADYYELSGLPLGTTWIVTKILWMRENEPELYEKTHKFAQNQDLVCKAFGAEGFHTDLCDMAFYGAWDVRNSSWSEKLLSLFELDKDKFGVPTIPGTQVGTIPAKVAEKTGFAVGTPICVGAGDQNCSVIGMGAVKAGIATVTLGTAGLAILSVDEPVPGFGGMMVTNHAKPNMWEVEGLSNAAASSFRWFRDEVGPGELNAGVNPYKRLDELAEQSSCGARGLLFMPYLATAASPRWNAAARGAFIGLSLAHNRADLTRSVMEGVAFEIYDMMSEWKKRELRVDTVRIGGGATNSKIWNQIQADIYGVPVSKVKENETTSLGAALLAGLGVGVFKSIDEGVENMVSISEQVEPNMKNHTLYQDMYDSYVKVYDGLSESGAFSSLAAFQQR